MKTATITSFRQRMKEHLDRLLKDQDILVLTGPKNRDFIVLTLEAFNAMEETAHLMSTRSNARRLMESVAQDRAGKLTVREPLYAYEKSKPSKSRLKTRSAKNSK